MAKHRRPPRRPRFETRQQRIQRLVKEGRCSLLPVDPQLPCPCPRKSGPEYPRAEHPKTVWHLTCRGCRHFMGLYPLANHVCAHPQARQVANRWLANAIRRWEESQRETPKQQLSLL